MFGNSKSDSLRTFRQQSHSGIKTWVMFFIGLVLMLLLALWTGSHNVPMMAKGTVEMFKYLGGAAALSGEVLLLVCYVLPFFIAGTQRMVTIGVGIWTFLILLGNSIIGYAQLAAQNEMFTKMVDFYGGYVAPFPLFITVFFGVMLIIETSEDIRQRNGEAASKVREQKRKTDMQRYMQAQVDEMLEQMPQAHEIMQAGAVLTVMAEVKALFKTQTGREPSDEELTMAMGFVQQRQPKSIFTMPQPQPPYHIPVTTGGNGSKNVG